MIKNASQFAIERGPNINKYGLCNVTKEVVRVRSDDNFDHLAMIKRQKQKML